MDRLANWTVGKVYPDVSPARDRFRVTRACCNHVLAGSTSAGTPKQLPIRAISTDCGYLARCSMLRFTCHRCSRLWSHTFNRYWLCGESQHITWSGLPFPTTPRHAMYT